MTADEWIASEASLLNLFFVAMAYLRQVLVFQKSGHLFLVQRGVTLGKSTKVFQLVILNVLSILLCEQVLVNPVSTTLREDDAPEHVLVQAFLEDTAA